MSNLFSGQSIHPGYRVYNCFWIDVFKDVACSQNHKKNQSAQTGKPSHYPGSDWNQIQNGEKVVEVGVMI